MPIGCGPVPPIGCCRFWVMAPSTLGTFLRSFTWGHVRQMDKALSETLRRVWSAGGGPDREPVTIDVDSTICEVSANTKHGASYGLHRDVGISSRWWRCGRRPQEIVHSRLRSGSSQKGAAHFVVETVNRARRAGVAGPVTVRADSGFWSYRLIADLDRLGVEWSITIPQYGQVKTAIAAIEETAWKPIDYPEDGRSAGGRDRILCLQERETVAGCGWWCAAPD